MMRLMCLMRRKIAHKAPLTLRSVRRVWAGSEVVCMRLGRERLLSWSISLNWTLFWFATLVLGWYDRGLRSQHVEKVLLLLWVLLLLLLLLRHWRWVRSMMVRYSRLLGVIKLVRCHRVRHRRQTSRIRSWMIHATAHSWHWRRVNRDRHRLITMVDLLMLLRLFVWSPTLMCF